MKSKCPQLLLYFSAKAMLFPNDILKLVAKLRMSVHNKDIIIMMNVPGQDTTGLLATKNSYATFVKQPAMHAFLHLAICIKASCC